ncbi:MAG: hypothetical protein DRP02_02485 [Candidatus Gerdarchaeota archaeon]|nr:MAG: hypothetical protein DRP02_02485 [Candidatus Gerdarchaeota archaeon]
MGQINQKRAYPKSELVRHNYFYESPYIKIDNPRPIEIYGTLFESTIEDYGFIIEDRFLPVFEPTNNKKYLPFRGYFKAYERKEILPVQLSNTGIAILTFFLTLCIIYTIVEIFISWMAGGYIDIAIYCYIFIVISAIPYGPLIKKLKKDRMPMRQEDLEEKKEQPLTQTKKIFIPLTMGLTGLAIMGAIAISIIAFIHYIDEWFIGPGIAFIVINLMEIFSLSFCKKKGTKNVVTGLHMNSLYFVYQGIAYIKNEIYALKNTSIEQKSTNLGELTINTTQTQAAKEKTIVSTPIVLADVERIEIKYMFSLKYQLYEPEKMKVLKEELKKEILTILTTQPTPNNTIVNFEEEKEFPLVENPLTERKYPSKYKEELPEAAPKFQIEYDQR